MEVCERHKRGGNGGIGKMSDDGREETAAWEYEKRKTE